MCNGQYRCRLSCNHYVYEKEIDTVVCLDGSEVIGTFLARQLSQKNLFSLSSRKKYLRRRTGARFQRTSDLPG